MVVILCYSCYSVLWLSFSAMDVILCYGCFNLFCNVWVCISVDFLKRGSVCVGLVCVDVCICGFCKVWMCVYVDSVKCGWVCVCVDFVKCG